MAFLRALLFVLLFMGSSSLNYMSLIILLLLLNELLLYSLKIFLRCSKPLN